VQPLKYLQGYPSNVLDQVNQLLEKEALGDFLLKKYPKSHDIRSEKQLYDFVIKMKNQYLKSSSPISKVAFDGKIQMAQNALGLNSVVSRVQGGKLKSKSEIRIAVLFKNAPLPFLNMIVAHELAHLKERNHDKSFYSLCCYMLPDYHQLEFDVRLYLTYLDNNLALY
jgi:hypothetical protein